MFNPVVDGDFIEIHPNDVFKNISLKSWDILRAYGTYDVMFGLTSDEGALYAKQTDALVKPDSEDPVKGYTAEALKDKIIPFVLKANKLKDTPTVRQAILHQYINWADGPMSTSSNRKGVINLLSDTVFNAEITRSAMMHLAASAQGKTYLYVFDHRSRISPQGIDGANHAEDAPFALGFPVEFLFNNFGINFTDPADEFTEADIKLSQAMMGYFGRFTKYGLVCVLFVSNLAYNLLKTFKHHIRLRFKS